MIETIEYLPTVRQYEKSKEDFYIDHLNIDNFLNLCKKNIKDLNDQLSFYDKFTKYQEIDPDIEVWTDLSIILTGKYKVIRIWPSYSISTSGKIRSHITHKDLIPGTNNNGYRGTNIRNGSIRSQYVLLHRAVLSSFTLDQLIDHHLLTVNHKEPNKEFNNLLNLEWMTEKSNILDAKTRKGYSVKLTLIEDYKSYKAGNVFYIHRGIDLTNAGIERHVLRNGLKSISPRYGFNWEKVDDHASTIPQELLEKIKNHKRLY